MSLKHFARQLVGTLTGQGPGSAARVVAQANPFGLEAAAQTDAGCLRSENQDTVYLENPPPGHHDHAAGLLAIVADGMGGHSGGGVASGLAATTFASAMRHAAAGGDVVLQLAEAIAAANTAVHQRAAEQLALTGMGTTFSALLVRGGVCHAVQIGDSRLYLLRDGVLRQLSTDHTMVNELVANGLLTPAQAVQHPDRNVLTRALGTNAEVAADVWAPTVDLQVGDQLMLCSDGLHDLVPPERLAALMQAPTVLACDQLVQAARAAGGHDNISAIVVRVVEGAPVGERDASNGSPAITRFDDLESPAAAAHTGGDFR